MKRVSFIKLACVFFFIIVLSVTLILQPVKADFEEFDEEEMIEEMDIEIEKLDFEEEFIIEDLWEDEDFTLDFLKEMEELRDPFRDFIIRSFEEERAEEEIPEELRDLEEEELQALLEEIDEEGVEEEEIRVEERPVSPPDFSISGYARRGGNYVVVVEHEGDIKLVSLGEELDGYRLIDWRKREVVFEKEGVQFRLSPGVK